MVWIYTLSSVAVVSLISLVGALTLVWQEQRLRRMLFVLVALATGALFGDVLIHLLPEIFSTASPLTASLGVFAGVLLFFILEKFLHWRHHHQIDHCDHPEHQLIAPLGFLSLISDGVHNFLDGVIIGVSFLASPVLGLASTLAIILHEIPQEMGDFAVLIHAGFSARRAIWFNLLSASLAIIGAVGALLIGNALTSINQLVLPFAAGGFLYLAGSDLVPELHKTTDLKKSLAQLAAMILGVILMLALVWWE